MARYNRWLTALEKLEELEKYKRGEYKYDGVISDAYGNALGEDINSKVAPTVSDYDLRMMDTPWLNNRVHYEDWNTDQLQELTDYTRYKSKGDNGFFQRGAFSDGYDFGDITKTILGTGGDALLNVGKGIFGVAEGMSDLLGYGLSGGARVLGMNNVANNLKEASKLNVGDKLTEGLDYQLDKYSLLGTKSDSVLQGLGQVGATLGIGALTGGLGLGSGAITGVTTGATGASAFGRGMSEAYNSDATDKDATQYGLVNGLIEAGTELIFGGLGKAVNAVGLSHGISSLDDALAEKISSKISNTLLKNGVELGVKSVGEGTEEVIAGFLSAINKKMTYMEDKELTELIKDEKLLDQFIVGAVTSGIAQTPGLVSTTKAGRDLITNRTENEQKFIDTEIQDRIKELENKGEKITNKVKDKIEKEVIQDLEKGYIDTDKIGSMLAEDSYKEYKTSLDGKTELENKIKELENKPLSEVTLKDSETLKELREKLENTDLSSIKEKYELDIESKLDNDFMFKESFLEKQRKGENFTADLNKYKGKAKETVQKAIESGLLNNTNKSHDFVDFMAKIHEDKGIDFDFTNNERLKDTGFALQGKNIDGFVDTDGKVTINLNSNNNLKSIVGHEITHILEDTEIYQDLQETIIDYAKMKGDYDTRYKELEELYKDIEGADISKELTSDLIGDYIFSDTDFVNNLSVKSPNIFQKIYNEVKYLFKVATSGSKEAKQLEKAKRMFEKAYKENIVSKPRNDIKFKVTKDGEIVDQDGNKVTLEVEPVDKEGTLLAMHNLSVDNLITTLKELEGFPMPSIAIHNPNKISHNVFGGYDGVSVVFPRESIDPEVNPANKVYDRDAYTPIFPRDKVHSGELVSNNLEIAKDFSDMLTNEKNFNFNLDELTRNAYLYLFGDENGKHSLLFSDINFGRSKSKILQNIWSDLDIKYAYAQSIYGNNLKPIEKNDFMTFKNLEPDVVRKIFKELFDMYGTNDGWFVYRNTERKFKEEGFLLDEARYKAADYIAEKLSSIASKLAEKEINNLKKDSKLLFGDGTPEYNSIVEERTKEIKEKYQLTLTSNDPENFLGDILNDLYIAENKEKNEIVIDREKTEKYINGLINTKKWLEFVESYFKDYVDKLISDKSLENNEGELLPYNAENIVEIMKENPDRNTEDLLVSHAISASLSKIFKSVEEMHDNEYRLVRGYKDIPIVFPLVDKVLYDLSYRGKNNILRNYSSKLQENKYNTLEEKLKLLNQIIGEERSKEYSTVVDSESDKKTEELKVQLVEKIDNIINNTTTHYFEAKPQRVIGYNEGEYVLIPDHIYYRKDFETLETLLKEKGIPFYLYSDSYEKLNIINSLKSYKFKLANENAPIKSENGVYGEDISLPTNYTNNGAEASKTENMEQLDYSENVPFLDSVKLKDIPELEKQYNEDFKAITDANVPTTNDIEKELYNEPETVNEESLMEKRDYSKIGNKKVKAYMYENPELKPFFQEYAMYMLSDIHNSIKGERQFNGKLYYESGGEKGFFGTKRHTTEPIAELLDGVDGKYKMTYEEIQKGLNAILQDNGKENNAFSKRIEIYLDKMLREGYTTPDGMEIPPNTEYINKYNEVNKKTFFNEISNYGEMTPPEVYGEVTPYSTEEMLPINENANFSEQTPQEVVFEEPTKANKPLLDTKASTSTPKIETPAKVLSEKPNRKNKEDRLKQFFAVNVLDKNYYINKLARENNNRQLEALADKTLMSKATASQKIFNGRHILDPNAKTDTKVGESITDIFDGLDIDKVKKQAFNEYMYHRLNTERMTLLDRYGEENKPVFGEEITADISKQKIKEFENKYPDFVELANRVYDYESGAHSDLSDLVENNLISQEQADYLKERYSNYVPIIRDIDANIAESKIAGKKINVKNVIQEAKGGNQNIIPLEDAMAIKTTLVQRSIDLNNLGIELMKTLNPSDIETEVIDPDLILEELSSGNDLIKAGTNGSTPTMTVFIEGKKVTFNIPQAIYEGLKPNYDSITKATIKPLNALSNFKRDTLTQYNLIFAGSNAVKDMQDILLNSQHPIATYATVPEAIAQLSTKGYWYKEMQNQGFFEDTYYDNQNGLDYKKQGIGKIKEFLPLKAIASVNDFVERIPRMAEYIASRKKGATIEEAMLDASRVTTNFKAGGDFTKFLNRNGATFLNASVQGTMQQVRNIQEAHQKGLKGYIGLASRYALAGLPVLALNSLLWDDDDEYEELNDYIKNNYYILAKNEEGKFIRIPKGRMVAVIQNAFKQISDIATGNDEADFNEFFKLVINNIAPTNPIESNIFSPFLDTKLFDKEDPGKTWYGTDLVPSKLQNKPQAEQFDEGTDNFSKWLGEKLNLSPIKINNLIDQNTGIIGDMILPMITPEVKTQATNPILAGLEDKFTADKVFDSRHQGEFYKAKHEAEILNNSMHATDQDKLSYKYLNAMQVKINELNEMIREFHNDNTMDNKYKYENIRDLKAQINNLAEEALYTYKEVKTSGNFATVGDLEFVKDKEGVWNKLSKKQIEKQNEVVTNFGISKEDYWSNKKEYDYAYENPEKYLISTVVTDFNNYEKISKDINSLEADKDKNGKTITNSRKQKVFNYINNLDLGFEQKLILAKSYYTSYDEYNNEILNYLDNKLNNGDIDNAEYEMILKKLKFNVTSGKISW